MLPMNRSLIGAPPYQPRSVHVIDAPHTHVSFDTVIRLVQSPITGKTLVDAVKDYKKKNFFDNYEEQDKGKEQFANAIERKLCSWYPGNDRRIHFTVTENGKTYSYSLSDAYNGNAVRIIRESQAAWDDFFPAETEEHFVDGVTLSGLQAHVWKSDPFQVIGGAQDENELELAQNQLGLLYESGINLYHTVSVNVLIAAKKNVPKDHHFDIMNRAQEGDAVAQYQLGVLYKEGVVFGRDNELAFVMFNKSAKQGNVEAQLQCGLMLERGIGCERDQDAAKEYFKQARAKNNLAKCYFLLANMKESVNDLHKVEPEAWVTSDYRGQRSRKFVYPEAFTKTMSDLEREMCMIDKSCAQSHFISNWINAFAVRCSMQEGMQNVEFAYMLEELAYQGYAPAQYQLGMKSWRTEQKQRCFEHAALQGYAPAQYELSVMLSKIKGQEQNSRQWLEKAAAQQYPAALKQLAPYINHNFSRFATTGQLFNGLENGQTNLPVLPAEIAAMITSYNSPDNYPEPATKTWFDHMVELIEWDNHGFQRD